jgi:hypothetical protein
MSAPSISTLLAPSPGRHCALVAGSSRGMGLWPMPMSRNGTPSGRADDLPAARGVKRLEDVVHLARYVSPFGGGWMAWFTDGSPRQLTRPFRASLGP